MRTSDTALGECMVGLPGSLSTGEGGVGVLGSEAGLEEEEEEY